MRAVSHNFHQNGTTERAIRAILNTARTLLIHGSVLAMSGPYSVVCAVFVTNRQPLLQASFMCPYKGWFLVPVMDYLRPYRCAACAYIPESYCILKSSIVHRVNPIYELDSHEVFCSNALI